MLFRVLVPVVGAYTCSGESRTVRESACLELGLEMLSLSSKNKLDLIAKLLDIAPDLFFVLADLVQRQNQTKSPGRMRCRSASRSTNT